MLRQKQRRQQRPKHKQEITHSDASCVTTFQLVKISAEIYLLLIFKFERLP